ncbi:hypothetical protein [Geodermatophilus sp. URMC 60]|jgi:hypothetical protein
MSSLAPVRHRRIDVHGIDTSYREAGPPDARVVLLPHRYPRDLLDRVHGG